jgi:esterase
MSFNPRPESLGLNDVAYKGAIYKMPEKIIEDFIKVNGVRLHYLECGKRNPRHVLLIHGWDGTAHYWDLILPSLKDRFHVVAITLRGRGKSDEDPIGEYSFDNYLKDIDEATQQLGMRDMIFVGASLGGLISLPYTVMRPNQVNKIVLCDIGAQLGGNRPSSYYTAMQNVPEQFSSLEEIEDLLREWSLYVKMPREGMSIVLRENFKQTSDRQWIWIFAHRLRELMREQPREKLFPSQWHLLPKISCPVLIIRGERSESLLPEVAERTQKELPNAILKEIPDCSHYVQLEAPTEFKRILLSFIRQSF